MRHGNFANAGGVVGGESDENQNAHIGEQELQHRVFKENIHDGRNDDAEECHEAEVSHTGQIFFRHVSVCAHDGKGAGRREEDGGDAGKRIENENCAHRESVQNRIDEEHGGRRFEREPRYGSGEMPDEGDGGDEKSPGAEFRSKNKTQKKGAVRDNPSGRSRDEKGNGHPRIDIAHETGHINGKPAFISHFGIV